jgi:tRNA (uracil-5-)-methyltransferase
MQTVISEQAYEQQLDEKLSRLQEKLDTLKGIENKSVFEENFSIFRSPIEGFRMRAEFRIWHEGENSNYAMHHPDTKEIYTLDDFPIASSAIRKRMPALIKAINNSDVLSRKIFQAEFLSTTTDEVLISLIYHRPLDETWQLEATSLSKQLNANIIGRSRKQKVVLEQDFVTETMHVNDQLYRYQQIENSFTQPNASICQDMLTWACEQAKLICPNQHKDLLELYCGNGNFTLPLAKHFHRVLATELAKSSVRSALYNIALNKIENIDLVRLSSEETTQALNKERPFRRLKDIDLDAYQFSTVFVDPPRAGLDEQTLELVKRFDNIMYISCNPDTFIDNAKALLPSHQISAFAVFDQFPYTHHLEIGAVFQRQT